MDFHKILASRREDMLRQLMDAEGVAQKPEDFRAEMVAALRCTFDLGAVTALEIARRVALNEDFRVEQDTEKAGLKRRAEDRTDAT